MAGRRPTPTTLKLVRGNPGKRPLNKEEPQPERRAPEKPARLTGSAASTWKQLSAYLERMGVLTIADGLALELLCDAYSDYLAARKKGWHQRAEAAFKRIKSLLIEFGLTPASRSRIKTGEAPADPLSDFLKRKPNA